MLTAALRNSLNSPRESASGAWHSGCNVPPRTAGGDVDFDGGSRGVSGVARAELGRRAGSHVRWSVGRDRGVEDTMKRVLGFVLGGALLAACGGSSRMDIRSTGSDAGSDVSIVLEADAAPRDRSDAGPPRGDAGATCEPWPGMVEVGIPPLSPSCMPRCSSATLAALGTCGTNEECSDAALRADTTPTISMPIEGRMTRDLNCSDCFAVQQYHCLAEVCPNARTAFWCRPEMDDDMCEGELEDLRACLGGLTTAERTRFDDCFNPAVFACFEIGDGFFPSTGRLPSGLILPRRTAD